MIFYSNSNIKINKSLSFIILSSILVLLLLGGYVVYFVLKMVFARSFVLGILFVFFFLPALLRLLFVIFFGIVSSLLKGIFLKKGNSSSGPDLKDDAIDVEYKIESVEKPNAL